MRKLIYRTYALADPRTAAIRYIGASRTAAQTYIGHQLSYAKRNPNVNSNKNVWLRSLIELNLEPVIVILEYSNSKAKALLSRKNWVNQAKVYGWELTNFQSPLEEELFKPATQEPVTAEISLDR